MARATRTVPEAEAGLRLDQFLARQPEVGSRSRAKDLIARGRVEVADARVKPGLQLVPGQTVTFEPEPLPPLDRLAGDDTEPPALPMLHEDEWLLAVDKPAGLSCHPPENRSFRGHTVAGILRARYGPLPTLGGDDRPGIVHRLDRDTSGVMVLARTDEAYGWLRAQWQARTVHKEYRCIAWGESRFDSDWIERPIASDPTHPDRMTVVAEGGRDSSTYYEVVERFQGFTHFLCRPVTGRTHQIRVHLTSIGHSLVGDRVYRSRRAQHDALPPGAPQLERQALHSHVLEIVHPGSRAPMRLSAPLAPDLEALLQWLRLHRRP
jgi:23S rRNA pseudouridine1911/1915/1917 synthase